MVCVSAVLMPLAYKGRKEQVSPTPFLNKCQVGGRENTVRGTDLFGRLNEQNAHRIPLANRKSAGARSP